MTGILDLPTELLVQCIDHARDLQQDRNSIRLTAKRFYQVLGPEPISHIVVYLSSPDSLTRLVGISQSPNLASTVETVTFDLSYYDEALAESLVSFASYHANLMEHAASCYRFNMRFGERAS